MTATTASPQGSADLIDRIRNHVRVLAVDIGARPAGSPGNREATRYIESVLANVGLPIEHQRFECLDWTGGNATIENAGTTLDAVASNWSLGCDIDAPFVAVSTLHQLEQSNLSGTIGLLHGEIAAEPLMPKNFPFYNPDHHQAIVTAIEAAEPIALITVSPSTDTTKPIIEDGDISIPIAAISQDDAEQLLAAAVPIHLHLDGQRRQGHGENLIVRLHPNADQRDVLTAHVDTDPGAPGALDNAAGVATLLAVAETLHTVPADHGVELAFLNGEDHYAAPGEQRYVADFDPEGVRLGINCDGVGLADSTVGVAPIGLPDGLAARIDTIRQNYPLLAPLDPWYQSDHMLFVANQIPTLAITSTRIFDILDILPTPSDDLARVDPTAIAQTAAFINALLN